MTTVAKPVDAPRERIKVGATLPVDVAKLLRQAISQVRIATSFTLDDGECVTWMLAHFARTYVSTDVLRLARKHEAIDRDGFLCSMPHCRRMVFLAVNRGNQPVSPWSSGRPSSHAPSRRALPPAREG